MCITTLFRSIQTRATLTSLLILLALGARVRAQTSYPMITHTLPIAVQSGKTTTVSVYGRMNLAGTHQVLFEGSGIRAVVLDKPTDPKGAKPKGTVSRVRLQLTLNKDAKPGVREFRLISTRGVSSIGQLLVTTDPIVQESRANDTRTQAQAITLPCVVSGRLEKAEDVDFFKFRAQAGETCTFEVHCARLQDKIHDLQKHADPMLTLLDAEGRELAANDDMQFADPMLRYTFQQTGDYYLQVRESKYDGDARWVYAVQATNQPHISQVYPMAGNPGKTVNVELVGSAQRWQPRAMVQVPTRPGLHLLSLPLKAGKKTNPVPFLVSSLPQVLEREPNDTPAQATRITLPCGINGRVQPARDLDHHVFHARKGERLRFEVKARRFGTPLLSSLDSVVDIMNSKGRILASNDDSVGKDALVVFTAPADGEYILRLRDLNSKGGPRAVYHIQAEPARPDFTLRCDGDKAMLAPGASTAWFVEVVRRDGFKGPVEVAVKGLPSGVTVNPLTIAPTMTEGILVLTASMEAPVGASNVEVVGTGKLKEGSSTRAHPLALASSAERGTRTAREMTRVLTRTARAEQEIYVPGGGRLLFPVKMQTVAVTQVSDILGVQVSPTRIQLKPGQEVKLSVTIRRHPDYKKAVSLDMLLRHLNRVYGNPLPPGVTVVASKSKTRLGTGNTGHIVLRAAKNAVPVKEIPVAVLAHVSINFVVKVSYASPPLLLTVSK